MNIKFENLYNCTDFSRRYRLARIFRYGHLALFGSSFHTGVFRFGYPEPNGKFPPSVAFFARPAALVTAVVFVICHSSHLLSFCVWQFVFRLGDREGAGRRHMRCRESRIPCDRREREMFRRATIVKAIEKLPDVKVYRQDFLYDIYKTLQDADGLGISATESTELNRNILRRKGRKIQEKGIGTTLLTKGLEFDTVVVLNAHRFTDERHLYVALTRCCKRLIIISNSCILNLN